MRKFGDLLDEQLRLIEVLDEKEYACAGVRLHGKGVFVREHKTGTEILKKFVQHEVKAGDVVFSTLFARAGAFAVAEIDVDGAILSEKFPTFRLVDDAISLDYLKWFFRSGQITKLAAQQVTGVAAFSLSHLSKRKFLSLPVPVPSKDRQEFVVRTCEEAFRRASVISAPIRANGTLLQHIVAATAETLLAEQPKVQIGSLGEYALRSVNIKPDEQYSQVTVAVKHRGLRLRRYCDGSEIRSPGQCYVRPGDILFSRIDIRQGAIGVVPGSLNGAVVTRDFPVFRLARATPLSLAFLSYVFRSPSFMSQAQAASRGTTGRKKLKRDVFLQFSVPWPSESVQENIVEKLRDVEARSEIILRERATQEAVIRSLPTSVAATLYGQDAGLVGRSEHAPQFDSEAAPA